MAPHSSTLAWKIPWTEEPGRLQSMWSWRIGQDWATSLSLFTFHFHALEKEMATHSSVLAWRIPETGEPGGLLSMGSHRVGHNWRDLAAAAAAAVYICQFQSPNASHPTFRPWYPYACSLCLCLYYRFANRWLHTYVFTHDICFSLSDSVHSLCDNP